MADRIIQIMPADGWRWAQYYEGRPMVDLLVGWALVECERGPTVVVGLFDDAGTIRLLSSLPETTDWTYLRPGEEAPTD